MPTAKDLVPIAFVVVVLVLTWPVAMASPIIGLGVAGLLGIGVLVLAFGADRASTVMLVLSFFFAPLALLAIQPPIVLASALFVVAFALALPRLLVRPLRLPAMFTVGALLFTIMGVIAVPLATSPPASLTYLFLAVLALIIIPVALAWMAPTERQMYAMALAFGIGTAVSTLYGLPRYTYRNAGFTYHPVALAYTAMLTLSFIPFLLTSKVRGRWILVPPVALVAVLGIWTSGSRTGLVVVAALLVLVPVLERWTGFGLLVAACFVVLLPTVINFDPSGGSTTAVSRLFGGGGAQGSDALREAKVEDGLAQIRESPIFGNGYSVEQTYTIHNIYLQVPAAEGLIGLVGLLLMFGALLVPLRRATAPQRCLAYPAVAVILAGPFQPNMTDHYLGLALGLSLVAAVGVMTGREPPNPVADTGAGTA